MKKLIALGIALSAIILTQCKITAVTGHSMEPNLPDGSYGLLVKVHDPHSIKVGDVVVFTYPINDEPVNVIHRVIEIDHDVMVTKGDNNPAEDYSQTTIYDAKYKLVGRIL